MRKSIFAVATLLACHLAHADGDSRNYAGVLLGPLIATHNASGTQFAWGGRIGTGIAEETWALPSIGLAIATSASSATVSGIQVDGRSTLIMAELIDREIGGSGLYFGARFGLTLSSVDVTSGAITVSGSGTAFVFSPVAGYEAPLTPQLALTLDASWLTFLSHNVTFPSGLSVALPTTQGVALLGGLTYRW